MSVLNLCSIILFQSWGTTFLFEVFWLRHFMPTKVNIFNSKMFIIYMYLFFSIFSKCLHNNSMFLLVCALSNYSHFYKKILSRVQCVNLIIFFSHRISVCMFLLNMLFKILIWLFKWGYCENLFGYLSSYDIIKGIDRCLRIITCTCVLR